MSYSRMAFRIRIDDQFVLVGANAALLIQVAAVNLVVRTFPATEQRKHAVEFDMFRLGRRRPVPASSA